MEFADLLTWVIAAAEGEKGMPLIPHIYTLPILFIFGVAVGYWYRGKKSG